MTEPAGSGRIAVVWSPEDKSSLGLAKGDALVTLA
jgi:hypothetical protein